MNTTFKKTARIALTVLVLFLCAMVLWADKWYRDYEKAMQAVQNKDWQQAVRMFNESLEKRDRPKQQARTVGLEFIDYLPYYYLGLAYFSLEQYAEAEEALEKSRLYAESLKVPALARKMAEMLAACRERLAAARSTAGPPAVVEDKTRLITAELSEKKEEEERPATDSDRSKSEPVLPDQRKSEALRDPVKTESAVPKKSEKLADPLEIKILELKKDVRARLREEDFAGAEQKLNTLLQIDAGRAGALAGLEKIRLARQVLQVNHGIRLYFEGDLDGAERQLQEVAAQVETGTVLARAHHFLAAVFAERHLREQDDSGAYPTEVRRHLQQAATADPDLAFNPDLRFFSPGVIRILNGE